MCDKPGILGPGSIGMGKVWQRAREAFVKKAAELKSVQPI